MGCDGLRALADFARGADRSRSWPGTTTSGSARSTSGRSGRRSSPSRSTSPCYGIRLHLVHGHRLGAQAEMEGVDGEPDVLPRLRTPPSPRGRRPRPASGEQEPQGAGRDECRHLAVYREYAATQARPGRPRRHRPRASRRRRPRFRPPDDRPGRLAAPVELPEDRSFGGHVLTSCPTRTPEPSPAARRARAAHPPSRDCPTS